MSSTQINKPAEVMDHIHKAWATLEVYGEEMSGYCRHMRSLAIVAEEIEGWLVQNQREISVCLDSLKRYSENGLQSREVENQRRMHMERWERMQMRLRQLQQIKEEIAYLENEAKAMTNDAEALGHQWKAPTMRLKKLIDTYLRIT